MRERALPAPAIATVAVTIRQVRLRRVCLVLLLSSVCGPAVVPPSPASAAVASPSSSSTSRAVERTSGASSLESAAAKAGNTGRAVAMSLIGLAFAVAGTVLAFRRDFKEAAAVFAVGIIAVLLATTAGVNLLRDTVTSLFGSR
jgi:sulfite exporter TauE/SafE